MFGEKAFELIKELQRTKGLTISPFNEDIVRQVLEEMKALFDQNQLDVKAAIEGEQQLYPSIQLRHAALERNKRCLLAYLYNRLQTIRQMRWDVGSVLPVDTKFNLSQQEIQWFNRYNKMLATYMRSIGGQAGLDLTQDIKPPKNLYIEVRCLIDHGEFETQDGSTLQLKKNSQVVQNCVGLDKMYIKYRKVSNSSPQTAALHQDAAECCGSSITWRRTV